MSTYNEELLSCLFTTEIMIVIQIPNTCYDKEAHLILLITKNTM